MTSPDTGDISADAEIDAGRYRTVLGHYASGITVIAGIDGGEPTGMTCQSFFSVSLDPPLVGFCPGKSSTTWPRIRPSGAFCVNVLSEADEATSRTFATSGADKFKGVAWRGGATGSPVLGGALAFIDCRIESEHDAGDHTIVVGRIVDLDADSDRTPLLYYRSGYARLTP